MFIEVHPERYSRSTHANVPNEEDVRMKTSWAELGQARVKLKVIDVVLIKVRG